MIPHDLPGASLEGANPTSSLGEGGAQTQPGRDVSLNVPSRPGSFAENHMIIDYTPHFCWGVLVVGMISALFTAGVADAFDRGKAHAIAAARAEVAASIEAAQYQAALARANLLLCTAAGLEVRP